MNIISFGTRYDKFNNLGKILSLLCGPKIFSKLYKCLVFI